MTKSDADVIVVGAGISGLYAARRLHQRGVKVLVLESRDRVSGRLFKIEDPRCGYVDMGGAFVANQQTKVMSVARELGVDTYNVNQSLNACFTTESGRMVYGGMLPPIMNPLVLLDMNNLIQLLDKWSKEVPLEKPWEAKRADEWDSMSMEDFIEKHGWTKLGKFMMRMMVTGPNLTEPRHVSVLFFLHNLHSCGGSGNVMPGSEDKSEMKFVGGSALLCEKMANQLPEGVIKLNCKVLSVEQTTDVVSVTTKDGHQYQAKRLITAIPPPALAKIRFEPSLPANLQKLCEVQPTSHGIKTVLYYKKQFWRDHGYGGQLLSQTGIICGALDDTKPDGTYPAIVGFICGDMADKVSKLSKDERQRLICEQYVREFQLEEFAHPEFYLEKDWSDAEEEVHTGRCGIQLFPPGVITECKTGFREPHDKVYFAGSETAMIHQGYMDGALRAAERVSRQVLISLGVLVDEEDTADDDSPGNEIAYQPASCIERHLPSVTQVIIGLISVAVVVVAALCGVGIYFGTNK